MKKITSAALAFVFAIMLSFAVVPPQEMQASAQIDSAVSWALRIANDSRYGYDQTYRWGPNYDCSSFLISAYQQAGVPVKTNGATYTGNMYSAFLKSGFSNVKSSINMTTGAGLRKGDVLPQFPKFT